MMATTPLLRPNANKGSMFKRPALVSSSNTK